MSDKRYEANIIRATAVEPANNIETTSAPGVWSLDEVMELQKKNKWPTVGNVTTDVDDVFSTDLWTGNAAAQVVDNGIALTNANEGGSLNGSDSTTGTAKNWINVPASSDFGFGTGDFTIELFFFMKKKKNYNNLIDFRTTNESNDLPAIYVDNTPNLNYFIGGVGAVITSSIAEGQWYHIAVSRSGTSTKMFRNGTQVGSTYTDNTNYVTPTATWSLGAAAAQTAYEINGFISNVRVIKGTALYTSNFTAPTSALTAVTNTKLLTLQGDTPFVDNSGNSVALTQNGSPVASKFGPFTGTSGEGGLLWFKQRTSGTNEHHWLLDTARTAQYTLSTNLDSAQIDQTSYAPTLTSNGFIINNWAYANDNNEDYVGWTFRKKSKFFDIQTWTGTGSARTISHNLGQVPGVIIVKRYSATEDWNMFHRSLGVSKYLQINGTGQAGTSSAAGGGAANLWNDTDPTSTEFSIGTHDRVNTNGESYVAYLFAHHNNDGDFGSTASDDIIKCGSYNGDGQSAGVSVDLGFEPQWVFLRRSDASGWYTPMIDDLRGMVSGQNDRLIYANVNSAESGLNSIEPTATGFKAVDTSNSNVNGSTWVYIAIRRGPLNQPTAATDVFDVQTYDGQNSAGLKITTNFITDANITQGRDGKPACLGARFIDGMHETSSTSVSYTGLVDWINWDHNDGFDIGNYAYNNNNGVSYLSASWKRAPGYFDIASWTGTGAAITINHNLAAVPKMIWVRRLDSAQDWIVYHSGNDVDGDSQPWTDYLRLDSNQAGADADYFNDTAPTSTTFQVKGYGPTGASGGNFIAYLFGEVAGISKLGSYSGNGSTTGPTVDCGFTSGARFVLIKRTDSTGDWVYFDTARGITSGDDKTLELNTQDAETTGQVLNPTSSGFQLATTDSFANASGGSYIFYAIA